MVCFCSKPLPVVPANAAKMKLDFSIPKIPLGLQVAAALPLLDEGAQRIDMTLNAALGNMILPRFSPAAGPMIGLAAQLNIAGGLFTLDDLPTLQMQMRQAAFTINSHVIPNTQMLLNVRMPPLLQLALIAKLKLSIDPIVFSAMMNGQGQTAQHSIRTGMALTPPKISMLQMVAGIPPLLGLAEKLNIPVGDPGGASMMAAKLQGMASLTPPTLSIAWPKLLRLAIMLDAIGTIQAAFGENALTPVGLRGIAATLNTLMRVPLPNPMPDLGLAAQLADLPKLESVRYGAAGVKNAMGLAVRPPRIGIVPFLNLVMALRLSLNDLLGLDPINYCGGMCKAPLPSFA